MTSGVHVCEDSKSLQDGRREDSDLGHWWHAPQAITHEAKFLTVPALHLCYPEKHQPRQNG